MFDSGVADEFSGAIPWTAVGQSGSETFANKATGIRVVVILTCSLSVLGSMLLIVSYVCFKQLRSRPREILMHISFMDFGVSLSNLIGAAVYFDQYYHLPGAQISNSSHVPDSLKPAQPILNETNSVASEASNALSATPTIEALCITQAFFAGYFTLGSIFWTIFLSLYIYLFLLYHEMKPQLPRYSLFVSYFVSYGMPLIISLWLVLTGRLGYAPYNSSGWCTLIVKNPSTGKVDHYAVVFGNDLWIYLALFIIPIFYLSSRNFIHKILDSGQRKQCRNLIYKFLFIPVIFLMLRMWTCVLIILYIYINLDVTKVPSWINIALLYLSGIGDSGQGLANAILFALFSQSVRNKLWRCLICRRQVIDIVSETTSINQTPDTATNKDFDSVSEDLSHLLYESIDNNSLLIEFDKSSRII